MSTVAVTNHAHGGRWDYTLKTEEMSMWYEPFAELLGIEEALSHGWGTDTKWHVNPKKRPCFFVKQGCHNCSGMFGGKMERPAALNGSDNHATDVTDGPYRCDTNTAASQETNDMPASFHAVSQPPARLAISIATLNLSSVSVFYATSAHSYSVRD
jgi:hypothetical protein